MMYVAAQALFIGSGCIALTIIGTILVDYRHKMVAALRCEPISGHGCRVAAHGASL